MITLRAIEIRIICIVAGAVGLVCCQVGSQPFAPRPIPEYPTRFGQTLLGDSPDLRTQFFDEATLYAKTRRGMVSLLRSNFIVTRAVNERSTNAWQTVADAVRDVGLLDRTNCTPQIRIIQQDAILQSTISLFDVSSNGYSRRFLEREFKAGDIVIITLHSD